MAKAEKKKPGKRIDYTSPKFLATWDNETLAEAVRQTKELDALRLRFEDARQKAGGLKKQLEAAQSEHFGWLRERQETRGKPPLDLFADVPAAAELATMGEFASPPPVAKAEAKPGAVPDDLWQLFPLARFAPIEGKSEGFGLTEKDIEILATGEIKKTGERFPLTTMGDVTRFTAPIPGTNGYTRKLTDIKGVGTGEKGLFERFQNAQTKFFEWWGGGGAEAFAAEVKPAKPKAAKPTRGESGESGETDRGGKSGGGKSRKGHKGKSRGTGREPIPTVEAAGPDATAEPSDTADGAESGSEAHAHETAA